MLLEFYAQLLYNLSYKRTFKEEIEREKGKSIMSNVIDIKDVQWDKKLNIHTTGRVDGHADEYHYPYEPTPYSVLVRLVRSGYVNRGNKIVDYGCGKGRVSFFLSHEIGCETVGIEYDKKLYLQAEKNRKRFKKAGKVQMICQDAAKYEVEDADCFYFFNPFSIEVFHSVMERILDSYYEEPRPMLLFFYYPNEEYVSYLMTAYDLMFVDEIDCGDLFDGENERERILIFEVG